MRQCFRPAQSTNLHPTTPSRHLSNWPYSTKVPLETKQPANKNHKTLVTWESKKLVAFDIYKGYKPAAHSIGSSGPRKR